MTSLPTADSEHQGLIGALPPSWRPFASLARFDRPIGWWLLYWPCAWGLLLADGLARHWPLLLWMVLGAIAMRAAGCVYNDIVDRDLDAKVERTRNRPLASGAVSLRAAWIWIACLAAIGLIVLLQLRWEAQVTALASLGLIAAYPFMKRITWWPQAWLGIVFSWGAPTGWMAATGQIEPAMLLLHAGAIFWVIGYDTIYALQDREDDALAGVKSSALRLGRNVKPGLAIFYGLSLMLMGMAIWQARPQPVALLALLPAGVHMAWQVTALHTDDGGDALSKFRSNRTTGFLIAMACLVVGAAP